MFHLLIFFFRFCYCKNLTLINCTVESLQGMCYIDNLVMKNCKLEDTTLAFEYSNVDAEVTGNIVSVLNPSSGTIKADGVDIKSNYPGWLKNIGYIPQTIFMTDSTIRRNVAFGYADDEIDDDDFRHLLIGP